MIAYKFISIILILNGILVLITGTAGFFIDVEVELGNLTYPISFAFIILGFISFYIGKTRKVLPEYSKCTQCKESYTYLELDDGMCPTCDIKTIDMDKYYAK